MAPKPGLILTASPELDMGVGQRVFDIDVVRADFPILSRTVHDRPLVYLDNAASAQKPESVLATMERAYTHHYANVHRGLHTLANEATEAFEGAREKVRAFINAESTDEVIFTRSATEALNIVADALGRHVKLGADDEILITKMEHHSNIVPWHFWRERVGAVIKWAPVDDTGALDREAFEALITPRTKIIALTHMSNVLGTINPVKDIVALAHAHGIPVVVDGTQGAVHAGVDVRDLDADFYAFTGHKLYGPTGIGVLYGKRALLDAMPPYAGGGEMIREVYEDRVTYGALPQKFEAGTPPIVQAIGLGAAIDYVNALGQGAIHAHENRLRDYARARLGEMKGIRLIGDAAQKGAIFSFAVEGAHAHDVATVIDHMGVAIRAGTHCAQPLLAHYGVTSTCRASFALYNTLEEVDVLVGAVEKARTLFG